ncbi:Ubiquinone/menaquinone biosynthesis C-methyltransferase UbiE [Mycobacterium pseudokansasii]|uniref:Ubiquinone/menaquinone biosynthesis C-methyltransferase UbiE n=2 Tax=Mycobacterium pseudokansasii TaxID=2341080 RepID=A0A498QT32_9MYCO|nr:Ubiquinone/menaquinone biosynthesis C-methyltransferase UbiE [Mycobacterium pseudokansasii]
MGLTGRMPTGHQHRRSMGWVLSYPYTYELVAEFWFRGRRARVWDRLVGLSGAAAGERVLDVGCGTGYFARRIAGAVGSGGSVVGIDPSQSMLDYARRHAPANCTFVAAGAEDLPLPDQSFDLVVSSLSFHHFPVERRADAVFEMFRVLRPGGRLFVADLRPSAGGALHRIVSVFSAHAKEREVIGQLGDLVTDAGFSITSSGEVSRLHYIAARRPDVGESGDRSAWAHVAEGLDR